MNKILCFIVGLGVVFTAHAEGETVYVGGKVGWTHFSNGCESHNLDCDREAIGAGVFLGYKLNDWLSIEGGYDYLGKAKAIYPSLDAPSVDAPYSAKFQGVELGVKADYYLNDSWNIFGKVGGLAWRADKKGEELNYDVQERDEDFSLMLGAGLEYRLTKELKTRIEYQWFDNVGGENTGGSNINFLTVGLTYSFGSKEEAPAIGDPEPSVHIVQAEIVTLNELNGQALFAFDSAQLSSEIEVNFASILERLKSNPISKLIIVGHTDSQGSEKYNERLSLRRAQSVANYFESNGIEMSRIQVEGRGETDPIADNNTLEGRSINRRVELISPAFSSEVKP
ncbi:MAG: OmpA family protein [Photobacterium aquimaris]|nr:OmpA family protein [Photobacterium aquimaris]